VQKNAQVSLILFMKGVLLMKEQSDSIIKTVPAAEALRKVPQFNPLRYLRQTTSLKTGEPVLKFDLRYKKMWFRLACSDGRMVLNPMRITDSMAIFEAQVYLHSDDPRPITNFISTMYAKNVPGGRYVQAAQDEALNEALDNAGFGIQLSDLLDFDNSECGTEIPVSQVERLLQTAKVQPAQEEHRATGNLEPQVESVQMEEPAPQEVQGTTIEEKIPDTAPNPPDTTAVVPEAKVTHTEPMPESPVEQATVPEQSHVVNETAGVLQMLGAVPSNDTAAAADDPLPQDGVSNEGEQPTADNTYTDEMTVEEIIQRMTLDEARSIMVTFGTCKGWTLGEVMERRASSLRFYLYSSKDAGNVLKAAASLLLDELAMKKAG
jgi:hypothetical protein